MEGKPKFVGADVEDSNYEMEAESAIDSALNIFEQRLGMSLDQASAQEKIAVTKELLKEIEAGNDNTARHAAELYAGIRNLAEIELQFQIQKKRLEQVLQ